LTLLEIAGNPVFEIPIHVVRDKRQQRTSLRETLRHDVDPRKVNVDPLSLNLVVRQVQRIGPGL